MPRAAARFRGALPAGDPADALEVRHHEVARPRGERPLHVVHLREVLADLHGRRDAARATCAQPA